MEWLGYTSGMPPRLKRFYETADLHFITFSCYHRKPYLDSPESRYMFLSVLEEVRLHYRFPVIGFVVMPEHVHLLLGKPERGDLSVVLQVLKQNVSRRASTLKSQHSFDPFWQRRFYDFNVRTEKKRVEKLRSMHRNPKARGLALEPDAWRWSSFRHYFLNEPSPVTIDSLWLHTWRPGVQPTLRKNAKDGHPMFFLNRRARSL